MMSGIIYKWTCIINNKSYIGSTIHPEERYYNHIRESKTKNPKSSFHKDLKKYGVESFTYEVIETCNDSELSEREVYWISLYDTINNGYNVLNGASGRVRSKHSIESRKAISDGEKRYWQSLSEYEKQERLSKIPKVHLIGVMNGMYGYNWSDEKRKQISETKKKNYIKRVWVHREQVEKLIHYDEYNKYIADGWYSGRK